MLLTRSRVEKANSITDLHLSHVIRLSTLVTALEDPIPNSASTMKMYQSRLSFCVVCLLVASLSANAQLIIYDTTAAAREGEEGINSTRKAAQSFVTPATDVDLSRVVLSLWNAVGEDGSFSVAIHEDVVVPDGIDYRHEPGNSIAILTGPNDPTFTGLYQYNPSSALSLRANTGYWVVASGFTATKSYQWTYTGEDFDPPLPDFGQGYRTGPFGWEQSSRYRMLVEVAPVPEPRTTALAATLCVLVALWHRRGR